MLQDALGVDTFNVSSEALAADALLEAYRSADEAAIRKVISSKPVFIDLDNQVSTVKSHDRLSIDRDPTSSSAVQAKVNDPMW